MIQISFTNGVPMTYGLVPGQSVRLELEDGTTWILERGKTPRLERASARKEKK